MDRRDIRHVWDDVAETYAKQRDPSGSDAALIDDLVDSLPQDATVLDVGCGDGARTLVNLPRGRIGLDISGAGLALAHETVPVARLVQGEMTTLPVAGDAVDAITAYHAVFHVPREEQQAVYREFARVLRPGGRLLMTLPRGRFQTVRSDWMGGRMFFSAPGREATLRELREAGFTVDRTVIADDPLGGGTEFVFARIAE